MYNVIKIGDKDVPMLAMASVDRYFYHVFHEDAMKAQLKAEDAADNINFVLRMGFIMAKFAELKDSAEMRKLNEDSFDEWLAQFDRLDMINALPDMQATYNGQLVSKAEAKKNTDEQSES